MNKQKRFLAQILALVLAFTMTFSSPISVFAEDEIAEGIPAEAQEILVEAEQEQPAEVPVAEVPEVKEEETKEEALTEESKEELPSEDEEKVSDEVAGEAEESLTEEVEEKADEEAAPAEVKDTEKAEDEKVVLPEKKEEAKQSEAEKKEASAEELIQEEIKAIAEALSLSNVIKPALAGETDTFTVKVTSSTKMFPVEETAVATKQGDGTYAVRYTMTASARRDYVAVGDPEAAAEHSIPWYANESESGSSVYTIPATLDETGAGTVKVTYDRGDAGWSNQATLTFSELTAAPEEAKAVLNPVYAEEEQQEEIDTFTVKVTSSTKMFPVEETAVATKQEDGTYAIRYTMTASARRDYVAVGDPEAAAEHSIPWYANESESGSSVYTIPATLDETGAGTVKVTYDRGDAGWSNQATLTFSDLTAAPDEEKAVLNPIKAEDIEEETNTFTVKVTSSTKMFPVEETAVATKQEDGTYAVRYTMTASTRRDYVAVGDAEAAAEHSIPWYANESESGSSVYTIPVELDETGAGTVKVTYDRGDAGWSNQATLTFSELTAAPDEEEAILNPIEKESEEETDTYTVKVVSSSKMFPVEETAVATKQEDGTYAVRYTMTASNRRAYVAVGDAEAAAAHTIPWYANETESGNSVYTIPVELDETGAGSAKVTYDRGSDWSAQSTLTFSELKAAPDEEKAVLNPIEAETEPEDDPTPTPGPDEEDPAEDPSEDPTDTNSVKVYKEDGTEYLMLRVTEYTAVTDGKTISITFKTTHETYSQAIALTTVDKISAAGSISSYERAADTSFTFSVPYSEAGKRLPLIIKTANGWKNEQYYIQIPSNPTKTDEPVDEAESKEDTEKESYTPDTSTDTNGTTSAVDNSTKIADGTYTPDSFSFSGGTGKLVITCNQITIKDGQAYATLHFSSSNVPYIKANGQTYYLSNQEVTIPVSLNQNMTIIALTTAMSQPHEITYQIYIGLAAAMAEGEEEIAVVTTVGDQYDKLDEKAPSIAGLAVVAGDEKDSAKAKESGLLQIFHYQDKDKTPYTLIEVDMVTGTALDPKLQKEKEEDKDVKAEEDASEEEEELSAAEKEARTADAKRLDLYKNNVIKYLVVPEDKEIPVGLDTLVVIIKQPADKTYVADAKGLEFLNEIKAASNVTSVGIEEEKDLPTEELKKAFKDGKISFGGTYDDLSIKDMIQGKTGLLILPSEMLPEKEEDIKAYEELRDKLANHAVQLEMPFIVLRSDDEEKEELAAKWYLAMGDIFNTAADAKAVYEKKLADA